MKKTWYTAKELTGLSGLPNSPQGVNLMARREGWELRRKRGIQGKAVEYRLESLPEDIRSQLIMSDQTVDYISQKIDPFQVWSAAYWQLAEHERNQIVQFILREGLSALLSKICIEQPTEQDTGET